MPRSKPSASRPASSRREERIELIEDLQRSLDPTDPEIDRLWAEEARDRLGAYLRGEMEARPFEEILRKYGKS